MGGSSRRCIGGLANDGTSVRLLTETGAYHERTSELEVGEIWNMTYAPKRVVEAPHVEDVLVSQQQYIRDQPNLKAHLLQRVNPWSGGIDQVFDGHLGFTGNNNGYISGSRGLPLCSTGFWIPDRDLFLREDGKHYDYKTKNGIYGLSFVGEQQAEDVLEAGSLIRVSLARWWCPTDAIMEKRCYLQLSGWY
jgi:hypothetical protein